MWKILFYKVFGGDKSWKSILQNFLSNNVLPWEYVIRQTQSWSCQDKIIMKWASLCHALVVKSSLRNLLVRVYKLYHGCAIITRILTFCKLFLKIFVARIWFLTKVLFVKLDITLYGKLWLKIALDSSCCGYLRLLINYHKVVCENSKIKGVHCIVSSPPPPLHAFERGMRVPTKLKFYDEQYILFNCFSTLVLVELIEL